MTSPRFSWLTLVLHTAIALGCARIDKSRENTTVSKLTALGRALKFAIVEQRKPVSFASIDDVMSATRRYRELTDWYLEADGWNRRFAVSDTVVSGGLRVISVHSLGADVSVSEDDLIVSVLIPEDGSVFIAEPRGPHRAR
jgi:hypothetical protein